jgi:EthD domain
MDKVLFLFHRKPGLTRQEFFDHYLQDHAPLGLRLTKTMDGYTVNLTDVGDPDPEGPDAITEVWTASAADFMDVDKSFETPEQAAELMADHNSFIGPYDAYLVEERIVRSSDSTASLGARSPGVKRVALYGEGEAAPEAGPDVSDVVEHRVLQVLTPGAPPVDVIVSAWAPTLDALGPATGRAYLVSEYRQKQPVA